MQDVQNCILQQYATDAYGPCWRMACKKWKDKVGRGDESRRGKSGKKASRRLKVYVREGREELLQWIRSKRKREWSVRTMEKMKEVAEGCGEEAMVRMFDATERWQSKDVQLLVAIVIVMIILMMTAITTMYTWRMVEILRKQQEQEVAIAMLNNWIALHARGGNNVNI